MRRLTIAGEKVFSVQTSAGRNVYLVSSTQVADELVRLALKNNETILIKISQRIPAEVSGEIRDIVSHHSNRIEILENIEMLERMDKPKEPSMKWIAIPTVALILCGAVIILKSKSPLIGSLFTFEKVEVHKAVEKLEVHKALSYR